MAILWWPRALLGLCSSAAVLFCHQAWPGLHLDHTYSKAQDRLLSGEKHLLHLEHAYNTW